MQAHSDTHSIYTLWHQSTSNQNCWYQRTQFRVSVIHSSFSQLFSVRNCLKWDPPFSLSSKNTMTLRHRQSTSYAVVTLRKIRLKSNFMQVDYIVGLNFVSYICKEQWVRLKSKPQRNGIWTATAWPPKRLCYRPTVFFPHSHTFFPARKNSPRFSQMLLFRLFQLFLIAHVPHWVSLCIG